MKKCLLFLFILIMSFKSKGQQTDLDFLLQKIKIDYPGYEEKTKGQNFDQFVSKAQKDHPFDTLEVMSQIVAFFKDGHLNLLGTYSTDSTKHPTTLKQDIYYLQTNKNLKKYEGFWKNESNFYVIAIIQENKNRYRGTIIECRDSNVKRGSQYYQFEKIAKRRFYTKVTSDASHIAFYVTSEFRNDSVMTGGYYNKWKKLKAYNPPLLPQLSTSSDTASSRWIDSSTYLITVPTSSVYNGYVIDSIIKAEPAITSRLQHLIIDIRGNAGGTVRTFTSLLPLLYTNPIVNVYASEYCTQHSIENSKESISRYVAAGNIDSVILKDKQEWLQKKEDSLGKFILMPQDTLICDSTFTYPKKVSIITNFRCMSAAEMFLLDAKQSKKVVLFGERTAGAIDYLNVYTCYFPSGRYTINMPTVRRNIPIGGKKLDYIGIKPDVKIGDNENDWVDFVKRYYEKR